QSKIVDQPGSRHCRAWCIRSPMTTACCPPERILTQQWHGECPGVGVSQNVSSSAKSSSTSKAWPAATTGSQLNRQTLPPPPARVSPRLVEFSQAPYSRLSNMYLAFGNVGTQRPLRNIVFQPVWSMCRCVQNTCVMSAKPTPATFKLSSQGCLGKSKGGGYPLSSPVQVSMRTVCLGVRTRKV